MPEAIVCKFNCLLNFIYVKKTTISCHLERSIVVHLNKKIIVFILHGNARFATLFNKNYFRHIYT